MAAYKLRYFGNPKILKLICPQDLFEFLRRFQSFFDRHGLKIPPDDEAAAFDYDRLIQLVSSPRCQTAVELVNSLTLIDEASSPSLITELIKIVNREGLDINTDLSRNPTELALQVWLADPLALVEMHAIARSRRPQTFDYFFSEFATPPILKMPTQKKLDEFNEVMSQCFLFFKRGRVFNLFTVCVDDEMIFLFQHGDRLQYDKTDEETLKADLKASSKKKPPTGSMTYRPLVYDVVVYNLVTGELRINAKQKRVKDLYCQKIGEYFFGDPDLFPSAEKYSLLPLQTLGQDSLWADETLDAPPIESIRLTKLIGCISGKIEKIESHAAADLFETDDGGLQKLLEESRLIQATFKFKFFGDPTPRTLRISPANVATYKRDKYAPILEQWMEWRQFAITPIKKGAKPNVKPLVRS